MKTNIEKSKNTAIKEINDYFDELTEELQQRRAILLSQVESKADNELKSIIRAEESHKTLQQKMQSQSPSTSVDILLKESPNDVGYDRLGVSFILAQIQQLIDVIQAVGQVRTVDFTAKARHEVSKTEVYNAIQMQLDDFPHVPDMDIKIPGCDKDIVCPRLDWDRTTASQDVTLVASLVSNSKPDPSPADTGCRIEAARRVLATRPLVIRSSQRVMYHVKVNYSVKQVTEDNKVLFELAVSSSPVDTGRNQTTGLSVRLSSCTKHKQQLCLRTVYDNIRLSDNPLTRNQVGESGDLHLGFVFDGVKQKIHVINVDDIRVIQSVADVSFDKPLWVMMFVDISSSSDMTGELVSGNKINVTQELTTFLSKLY